MNTRETAEHILDGCAKRQIAAPEWGTPQSMVTEYDETKLTNAIDSALQQAIADERAAKWQPIETAPHDEGYYQLVARFEDGKLLWWEKAKPYQGSQWKSRGGIVEPTHWKEVK